MNLASIDTIWLIAALVLLNVFLVTVTNSGNRFWHPPILLWVALFFTLVLLQVDFGDAIEMPEPPDAYRQSQEIDSDDMVNLQVEQQKDKERLYREKTFRLLGTQGFIALCLLTVGYQKTGMLQYRKAAISFVVISLVYLLLEIVFMLNGFGL